MVLVRRPSALALAGAAVVLVGLSTAVAADSPSALIAQADRLYMTRYVQEDMAAALAMYEALLPSLEELSIPSQAYVLNRLSQLCYEATTFTEGNTAEDGELFRKGKEYGFRSLRLDEEFVAHESEGLEAALAYVTDVAAMHWTANNWGMLCGMNPIQGLLQQGSVLALFSRSVELNPQFWGASSASALGSLLIMLPGALGGDKERGLALIEESIDTDPAYLHNRVILAEYWGFTYNYFGQVTGVRDAELIEREAAIIFDGEVDAWPFWNRQARINAERLLARLRDLTD